MPWRTIIAGLKLVFEKLVFIFPAPDQNCIHLNFKIIRHVVRRCTYLLALIILYIPAATTTLICGFSPCSHVVISLRCRRLLLSLSLLSLTKKNGL